MIPESYKSEKEFHKKLKVNFLATVAAVICGNLITDGCNEIRTAIRNNGALEQPAKPESHTSSHLPSNTGQ